MKKFLVALVIGLGVLAVAEEVDPEILKNLDFFIHMDVVEDLDTLDRADNETELDELLEKPAPKAQEGNHAKI